MSRGLNLALLTALRSHDQGEQLSALRSLKNDIVGHVQKKEKWIEEGVLEPIVNILDTSRAAAKPGRRDSRSHAQPSPRSLVGEESARLQALQIVASLANGNDHIFNMRACSLLMLFFLQAALPSSLLFMQPAPCLPFYPTYHLTTTHRKSLLLPSGPALILLR